MGGERPCLGMCHPPSADLPITVYKIGLTEEKSEVNGQVVLCIFVVKNNNAT